MALVIPHKSSLFLFIHLQRYQYTWHTCQILLPFLIAVTGLLLSGWLIHVISGWAKAKIDTEVINHAERRSVLPISTSIVIGNLSDNVSHFFILVGKRFTTNLHAWEKMKDASAVRWQGAYVFPESHIPLNFFEGFGNPSGHVRWEIGWDSKRSFLIFFPLAFDTRPIWNWIALRYINSNIVIDDHLEGRGSSRISYKSSQILDTDAPVCLDCTAVALNRLQPDPRSLIKTRSFRTDHHSFFRIYSYPLELSDGSFGLGVNALGLCSKIRCGLSTLLGRGSVFSSGAGLNVGRLNQLIRLASGGFHNPFLLGVNISLHSTYGSYDDSHEYGKFLRNICSGNAWMFTTHAAPKAKWKSRLHTLMGFLLYIFGFLTIWFAIDRLMDNAFWVATGVGIFGFLCILSGLFIIVHSATLTP
jgi:hypothetical protein